MRNTVHLVTAADFLSFRPMFQPLMERALSGNFGRNLAGVDLAELQSAARALLAGTPLTRTQLAAQLAPRWPDRAPAALAYAATHLLHLRPPPRPAPTMCVLVRFRNIQFREVSPRFVPAHI